MLPQFNNFLSSTVRGLPQPGAKPATMAEAGGAGGQNDMMAMIKQLIAGGQGQPQGGGIPSNIWAKLLEDDGPVDVVGQHNAGSNLPSYAKGYTGPFRGDGGFKPMDQAFPELANPAPFAGGAMAGQPNQVNPFASFGALVPQPVKKPGFGVTANPQPGFRF